MSEVPKQVAPNTGAGKHVASADKHLVDFISIRSAKREMLEGLALTPDQTRQCMKQLVEQESGGFKFKGDLLPFIECQLFDKYEDIMAPPRSPFTHMIMVLYGEGRWDTTHKPLPSHRYVVVAPLDDPGVALQLARDYGERAIIGCVAGLDGWPFLPCAPSPGYPSLWLEQGLFNYEPDHLDEVNLALASELKIDIDGLYALRYRLPIIAKQGLGVYDPGSTGIEKIFRHHSGSLVAQIKISDLGRLLSSENKLPENWGYYTL
jgi:hypothetical protein